MTADEMRRASTLALVCQWSLARDEARAAVGTSGHDAAMARFRAYQSELAERRVDLYSLARAIDADGSRS